MRMIHQEMAELLQKVSLWTTSEGGIGPFFHGKKNFSQKDIAELSTPERIGIGNCWSVCRGHRSKEHSCFMRTLTYPGYWGVPLGPQVLYYECTLRSSSPIL